MVKILKRTEGIITFLAYLLPISILLLIFYLNFLPFGYTDKKVLDVGSNKDTIGAFYIEENKYLDSRKTDEKGHYRFLNGFTYINYTPKVVLGEAKAEFELVGENIYFSQVPNINFIWDYNWTKDNFKEFDGDIKLENDCLYLDGETRLTLSNSKDLFEKGPFVIYIEWIPNKIEKKQQIIGHYNWEIFQNEDSVTFQIGRTLETQSFYSVKYQFDENFLNKKQTLLAIYNPKSHIELFVNGFSKEKAVFKNEHLDPEYSNNLSLGLSYHDSSSYPYFQGSLCNIKFAHKELFFEENKIISIDIQNHEKIRIPILGQGKLENISVEIQKL